MNKRDLKADLELCNRATPEPWTFHEVEFQCGWDECPYEKKREDNSCLKCDGVEIYQSAFVPEVLTLGCGEYDGMNDADAEFIAQAREGWPHAIERAIRAEKQLEELLAWEKPKEKCYLSAMRRIAELEFLVRELVDMLGRVTPRYLEGRLELDLDLISEANGLLKKAREVLGDDKVHAGRQSASAKDY